MTSSVATKSGRTVIAVAVADWMLDWLTSFGAEAEALEPEEDDCG